jgi:F420-0:gamma-glutamyl ligase
MTKEDIIVLCEQSIEKCEQSIENLEEIRAALINKEVTL